MECLALSKEPRSDYEPWEGPREELQTIISWIGISLPGIELYSVDGTTWWYPENGYPRDHDIHFHG